MLENEIFSLLLLSGAFAASIFVVLNGPLWLSGRARFFTGGPRTPVWLHRGVSWTNRLIGLTMLVVWAWFTTGVLRGALFLWLILAIGLFCAFDGPTRIITKVGVFRRGDEAPAWMESMANWFIRLIGAAALLSGLVVGITAAV